MTNSLTTVFWDTKLPIYQISHEDLKKKGIKSLLIDVDGTLLNRKSIKIPIPVLSWMKVSKELFNIYLISNNPSEKRISRIGDELGLKYKFKALKPSKKLTMECIKSLKNENKNIAIIGDRILTDIAVGNRCKIKTILVKRIDKKGLPINFNMTLFIERFISLFIF